MCFVRRPEANLEKLKCLLSYFSQVVSTMPSGLITYKRVVLSPDQLPDWTNSTNPLARLHIDSRGMIETEGSGMLQADFANKFVGGGVLRSGLVQEEIRFTICPELLASLLFTEVLGDLEVLLVTGVQQFTKYSGYGNTFRFEGKQEDKTETDSSGRKRTSVVAMDAIRFSGKGRVQYRADNVDRELNKAFVAFHGPRNVSRLEAVATGNWGCGAFGGDPRLKLVIQLLAASEAGRDITYFTFEDKDLVLEAGKLYDELVDAGATVGRVYKLVREFNWSRKQKNGEELFEWLHQEMKESGARTETVGQAYGADTDSEEEVNDGRTSMISMLNEESNRDESPEEKKAKPGFFDSIDKMEQGKLEKLAVGVDDLEESKDMEKNFGQDSKIDDISENVGKTPNQSKITAHFYKR